MNGYMGVTCHYFEEDFKWQSRILGCFYLKGHHDNINFKTFVEIF